MSQPQWSSPRGPIECCGGRCLGELSGGNWMTVDPPTLTGWGVLIGRVTLFIEVAPTYCVLTSVPLFWGIDPRRLVKPGLSDR